MDRLKAATPFFDSTAIEGEMSRGKTGRLEAASALAIASSFNEVTKPFVCFVRVFFQRSVIVFSILSLSRVPSSFKCVIPSLYKKLPPAVRRSVMTDLSILSHSITSEHPNMLAHKLPLTYATFFSLCNSTICHNLDASLILCVILNLFNPHSYVIAL